jgi:hypothetical protein
MGVLIPMVPKPQQIGFYLRPENLRNEKITHTLHNQPEELPMAIKIKMLQVCNRYTW